MCVTWLTHSYYSIHFVGSFGTKLTAPSADTTPATCPITFHPNIGQQLGFIADYGLDGWDVGDPVFSGDYFTPGDPMEGFLLQYMDEDQKQYNAENKGLQYDEKPSFLKYVQIEPTAFEITSDGGGSDGKQSAVWQSTLGDLQITKVSLCVRESIMCVCARARLKHGVNEGPADLA